MNECIQADFLNASQIAIMPEVVSTQCGFEEGVAIIKPQQITIELFMNKTAMENRKLQTELVAVRILAEKSIAKLEEAGKAKDDQIKFIKMVYDRLDAARIETCAAKTNELETTLHMKLREIEELLNDSQRKAAEIIDKNQKIDELQKKIEMLSNKM